MKTNLVKNFLILNLTGKEDIIGFRQNNKFFKLKLQPNKVQNDELQSRLLNFTKKNKLNINKKTVVMVNCGPGSYSRIRASIAIAKALKLIFKLRVIGYDYFKFGAQHSLMSNNNKFIIYPTKNNLFFLEYYKSKNKGDVQKLTLGKKMKKIRSSAIFIADGYRNINLSLKNTKLKINYFKFNVEKVQNLIDNNLIYKNNLKPIYLN